MENLSHNEWQVFISEPGERTFAPVYEASKALVWTLCLRILGCQEDALDAFQATWCRLLVQVNGHKCEIGESTVTLDYKQFIYQLAVREAQNLRKRRNRRARKELAMDTLDLIPGKDPCPGDQAALNQLREQLETMVRLLPDDYRLPLQLNLFHGLSQQEISFILKITQSTVSRRIDKGLKKLKSLIKRAGLTDALKGGIALGTGVTLLNPPDTLGACTVFAKAQSAIGISGITAAVAPATLGTSGVKLFSGVLIMKTKIAVLSVIVVIVLMVVTMQNEFSKKVSDNARSQSQAMTQQQTDDSGNTLGEFIPRESTATDNMNPQDNHKQMTAMATVNAAPIAGELAIVGQVIDSESKKPISGALIQISDELNTLSGPNGFYNLNAMAGDSVQVKATAEGYAEGSATIHVAAKGITRNNFALDPAITVLVQVSDIHGDPVAGAKIDADNFHVSFIERLGITDKQGQLTVPAVSRINPPSYFLAKQTGYLEGSCKKGEIIINPEKTLGTAKIVLEAVTDMERVIVGEIKDAQGRPVPAVSVQWSPVMGRQEGRDTTLSDQNGRYILVFEHETKDCQLSIYREGWAPAVREGVFAGTADKPAIENFTMDTGHWLSGLVVDETRKPVVNARIHVMPEPRLLYSWNYPGVTRRTETGADGRFRLENLSGPQVALSLRGPGENWSDLRLNSQEVDRDITLSLKPSGIITGRVLDKETGEPVPTFNVKVFGPGISVQRIDPGETFNSPAGEFTLPGLNQGSDYDVTVEAEGYVTFKRKTIPSDPPQKPTPHEFRISHGREIEGYVVDGETNAPIEGAKISHGIWDGGYFGWGNIAGRLTVDNLQAKTVDSSGQFRFIEDEPGTIFIQAEGYRHVIVRPEDRSEYQMNPQCLWVPLKRGESISGIYFANGQPAKVNYIGLAFIGEAGYATQYFGNIAVRDDGSYSAESLEPGTFEMDALWRFNDIITGGATRFYRQFELAEGEHKLVNMGDDLGDLTFSGRLLDMQGRPLDCVQLTLKPEFTWSYTKFDASINAMGGGRFRFPNLKPGRYAVEVIDNGKSWPHVISLPSVEITGDLVCDLQVEPIR